MQEIWCSVLTISNLIVFCSSYIRHKIDLELVKGGMKVLVSQITEQKASPEVRGPVTLILVTCKTKYSSFTQPIQVDIQDGLVQ